MNIVERGLLMGVVLTLYAILYSYGLAWVLVMNVLLGVGFVYAIGKLK